MKGPRPRRMQNSDQVGEAVDRQGTSRPGMGAPSTWSVHNHQFERWTTSSTNCRRLPFTPRHRSQPIARPPHFPPSSSNNNISYTIIYLVRSFLHRSHPSPRRPPAPARRHRTPRLHHDDAPSATPPPRSRRYAYHTSSNHSRYARVPRRVTARAAPVVRRTTAATPQLVSHPRARTRRPPAIAAATTTPRCPPTLVHNPGSP